MSLARRLLSSRKLVLTAAWRPLLSPTPARYSNSQPLTVEEEETVANSTRTSTHAHIPAQPPSHYKPAHKETPLKSFQTGEVLGTAKLHHFVFGAPPRVDILHRVVVWQRAKRREGSAKVKDRSEVRGGGRKPRPQKGTGRSRQGSIRAPQWRGGGVVHGPRGPKSYEYTLPKKVKRLALRAALSVKHAQGDLTVVDALQTNSHKLKEMLPILEREGWESVLFVDGGELDSNLCYATRNLQSVDLLPSRGVNVYSMLLRKKLVLSLGAVRMLEQRLLEDCTD